MSGRVFQFQAGPLKLDQSKTAAVVRLKHDDEPLTLCQHCTPADRTEVRVGHLTDNGAIFSLGCPLESLRSRGCQFCNLVYAAAISTPGDGVGVRSRRFESAISTETAVILVDLSQGFITVHPSLRFSTLILPPKRAKLVDRRSIDLDLVKSWYLDCKNEHGSACTRHSTMRDFVDGVKQKWRQRLTIRLIDVRSESLVRGESSMLYVALSYVWGGASMTKLLKENESELSQPGALSTPGISLPRTIRDAIELTRRLGERFLWIDSLCLTQDDSDEMSFALSRMDLIYDRAVLTIIAANGHDANACLPGVRENSRSLTQKTWSVAGTLYTVRPSFSSCMASSEYQHRAWT